MGLEDRILLIELTEKIVGAINKLTEVLEKAYKSGWDEDRL